MGLPLFITPVEPEVASRAEKATSESRSSIRRHRSVHRPHAHPSSETRRRRLISMGLMADARGEEFEVDVLEPPTDVNPSMPEFPASLQSRAYRQFEQERIRLQERLSFERHHEPSSEMDAPPLMPPVPESRDFYASLEERQREIERLRQVRRMARRHPAPTPPYTDRDEYTARRGISISSPRPASLTPAMSPSHQASESNRSSPQHRVEEADFGFTANRAPTVPSRRSVQEPARFTIGERVQSLNRSSSERSRFEDRNRRMVRQARLDGLGDRDRSLSPDGGAVWDTLLGGINPDPQPPSAGSSFASASAAAAASSASNSGPASASTSMTSLGMADSPTLRDCDVSEPGSHTEEEEEEDIYELQDFNRNRGDRFWRSYADAVTTRGDRTARNTNTADAELSGMHHIISRLVARDEIPDSWWASAGLSRNLRREPAS